MKLHYSKASWRTAGAALLAISLQLYARADYPSTVLSQGPVGYWRLNETTQPVVLPPPATDNGTLRAAGNGNYLADVIRGEPGALSGSTASSSRFSNPEWVVAYYGSRVDVSNNPGLNPNGPFTIELWAKPSSTAPDLFAPVCSLDTGQNGGASRNGYLVYLDGAANRWNFRIGGTNGYGGNTISGGSATTGAWHHVVGVYTGARLILYVDGAQAAAANANNAAFTPNTTQPFRIGATTIPNRGFDGWIEEVAFYNTALDTNTVVAHYNAGTTLGSGYAAVVLASNPVGYWRLGEPGDPATANLGSLGAAGNGRFLYKAMPGQAGPRSPTYSGFDNTNNSVGFDGTGGSVNLPPLNLNTNTVTITGWVLATNPQPAAGGIVLSRAGKTTAGITFDAVNATGLELTYNWNNDPNAFNWLSGLSLADTNWNFVALIVQPNQAALFTASATDATTFTGATNPIPHAVQRFAGATLLGADSGYTNRYLSGRIDEVAIFNRALGVGEVFSQYASAIGGVAPRIFADPQPPADPVYVGDTLNLTVDAGGTPLLSYQWRKGGASISGATSNPFTIASVAMGDTGSYDVVVTNAFGKVTSQPAMITVSPVTAPVISQNPQGRTMYPGGTLTLNVVATGGQLSYYWQKNNNLVTTNRTYVVNSVTTNDSGTYIVVVSNRLGMVTSTPPATVTVVNPVVGSFEYVMTTNAPEAWWRLDEPAGSSIMFDAMGRHDGIYTNSSGNPVTLGVPGVVAGSADTAVSFDGSSSYGMAPYSGALNTANFSIECWAKAAVINATICPASTRAANKGCWFWTVPQGHWSGGVSAGGTDFFVPSNSPDTVQSNQWVHMVLVNGAGLHFYVNGQSSGAYADFDRNATGPFLIGARGVNPGAVDEIFKGVVDEVAVYTRALSQTEIQNHYAAALYGGTTKPVFKQQPLSQTVVVGSTVHFSTLVEGTLPLTLQWLKNGAALANATNANLNLTNVTYSDAGTYQLSATNPAGNTLSAVATLVVMPVPAFANLTNGLVLHLKFDGDYKDSSGRGNNGTPVGGPSFVTGKLGSALHYSTDALGVTNYVTLGMPTDLQFGMSSFSVAFWVREVANSTNGDLPFLDSATNSANNFGFTFAPSYQLGGWQWCLNDSNLNLNIIGADNSINDGNWHHLVHTFDRASSTAITYLDGVQVDSSSIANLGSIDTGGPIMIGQDPTGNYPEVASTALDDLGIWRRALTAYDAYSISYVANKFGKSFDTYGPVTITLAQSGNNWVLIWQAGTLLQADSLAGPWTPVAGATAPSYTLTPGAGSKFYRVQL